ncbi:MAG TPA: hypothetical protein VFC17_05325 [Candidatus Limnocylindrales bacterium]|nr:hypothetical protein [Candidatus Limnocylindrales bacterium]
MNLGKMLAAGKSFISGGAPAAYRENKRVYLPKFNSEKNPFTPKAPEQNVGAPVPAKKNMTPAAAKTQTIPVFASAPLRATNWTAKLNPFRAAQPAAPVVSPTVQTELSLDAVKVVQNDLTDADVEVVPVRSRTVTPAEVPMLQPAQQPWEFMGERLLKSI